MPRIHRRPTCSAMVYCLIDRAARSFRYWYFRLECVLICVPTQRTFVYVVASNTLQKVRWVYPPRWWYNPTICSTHYGGFELIVRTHQNSWDNPTICSTHYGGFELIVRTHQNSWVVQHSACMCACVEGWGLTARARVLWLEVRRH